MLNDSGNADVSAMIADNKGDLARQLASVNKSGLMGNLTWDGSLDDGRLAPEGNYTMKVSAASGNLPLPQFFMHAGQSLLSNGSCLYYYPYSPVVDGDGNLYITDARRDCVLKFDPQGNLLLKWGSTGHGDGQFSVPTGIAVDSSGNVFVVDSENDRVEKFNGDGHYLLQFGTRGAGDGQFDSPSGIATGSGGSLFVVDTLNSRVQHFDGNGTFLGQWGSPGSGEGMFSNPMGIATDDNGYVYVADTNNDRIQKFSQGGTYVGEPGNGGEHGLVAPSGIAVSRSGRLLVADSGNRRMIEYMPDGSFLKQDYAPACTANRSTGSLVLEAASDYLARWAPIGDDAGGFACLTDHGCVRVNSFNPLNLGGPTSYYTSAKIVVDKTPPVIGITTPVDGINYGQNQKIAAVWGAADNVSGIDVSTGTVPDGSYIDTAVAGIHDFTVQAIDKAGNKGSLTYRYNVMPAPMPSRDISPAANSTPAPGNGGTGSPTPAPSPTPIPTPSPVVGEGPIGAIVQLISGDGSSTQIQAEVARTSDQINQGLMYRTSMAADHGMIFVFSGDGMHSFHMMNTYIPLDMLFINSDLQIVSIKANAQPLNTDWIPSGSPCHYVLEVNGGVCAAHNINTGNHVSVTFV